MIFALKITGDKLIKKKIGIERVPCKKSPVGSHTTGIFSVRKKIT